MDNLFPFSLLLQTGGTGLSLLTRLLVWVGVRIHNRLNAGSAYALWALFLAVMSLRRVKLAGLLTRTAKVVGYPISFVGLALDHV